MKGGRDWVPREATCKDAIDNIRRRYSENSYEVLELIPKIKAVLKESRIRACRFRSI